MGWSWKSPTRFKVSFTATLRRASAEAPNPILLEACGFSRSHKDNVLEAFRHFKWCIKQDSRETPDLFHIVTSFDIRATVEKDDLAGYLIFIKAVPTKISEFERLNPELAQEILPQID
jgi:hypothetical protein